MSRRENNTYETRRAEQYHGISAMQKVALGIESLTHWKQQRKTVK